MPHAEIDAMRPDRGRAALGVDPSRRGEAAPELILGGKRRHRLEPILDRARERQPRAGEGPARLTGDHIETYRHLAPRRRHGDAVLGHALLQRTDPDPAARPAPPKPAPPPHC